MVVYDCMDLEKDQTVSLAFEWNGVAVVEHTIVGVDVVVTSAIDAALEL